MEFRVPYTSIEDIGTVFVYLNKKFKFSTKRICFWKGSIMQFTNPNPELRWLQNDKQHVLKSPIQSFHAPKDPTQV
jgi:hypothetical protein